ncbi:hypothetical protein [Gimesia aquarii]|uniref:Uncharacterized protein n=1 Tax=Gimesia aquarii TaxID=2527964 RepID=A0A517W2E2_9PLAN|nr:hypothetical protein [Gimesia aquarii]QDT99396.1 hypothetical protein V144x_49070 [Gimesia aquarii]
MIIMRGMIAGLIGALVGGVVPLVLISLYTITSWYFHNTYEIDRQADIAYWRNEVVYPILGVAIYFGLAAWATYTPKGNYRFTKTLAILFFLSIPLTLFIRVLRQPTPQYKTIEVPNAYFSEFLLLFLPPLLITCVMIAFRSSVTHNVDTISESDGRSKVTSS